MKTTKLCFVLLLTRLWEEDRKEDGMGETESDCLDLEGENVRDEEGKKKE